MNTSDAPNILFLFLPVISSVGTMQQYLSNCFRPGFPGECTRNNCLGGNDQFVGGKLVIYMFVSLRLNFAYV